MLQLLLLLLVMLLEGLVTINEDPSTAFDAAGAGAWEAHDFLITTTWAGTITDAGGTSRSGTTRNEGIGGNCEDFPSKQLTLGA